jgi:hypothetical protein
MWEDSRYCWVVLCKNHWFHIPKNLFFRHRIALAETDAVMPRPSIKDRFTVRCDECGKEYIYKPSEVLKYEQPPPEPFTPHPLFRDEVPGPRPVVVGQTIAAQSTGVTKEKASAPPAVAQTVDRLSTTSTISVTKDKPSAPPAVAQKVDRPSTTATISTANDKPSVSPAVAQTVDRFSTTTTISAAKATYGTPASVTVSVGSSGGTLTGTVALMVDGSTTSSMALSNGSAVFNLGILNAGSHALTASFAAQGSFASSSAFAALSVAQAPLTVTTNNATRPYGAKNPALTGTVLGLQNGDLITASFTTTAMPSSPMGAYPVTPAVVDPSNRLSNYAVTLVNGTLTVVPESTSLRIAISPQSVAVGQSTTVTVNLTAPDMVIPIDPSVLASVAVTSPIVSDTLTNNGACMLVPGAAPGIATCHVTLTAVEPNGRTLLASFPGTANLAASTGTADLVVTDPLEGKVTSIKSDFHNFAVPGGSYLWFNGVFKIKGVNKQKVTVTFFQSSVQFQYRNTNNSLVSVNQALPDAKITFDPGVSSASTMFDALHNLWITTVPFELDEASFLTGIPWLVPAGGIPADIEPATWSGRFASDTAAVVIDWRWSAEAYSSFSGDNSALGVKAMSAGHDKPPVNRDGAGTPENFKAFVIPGAGGKGGKN